MTFHKDEQDRKVIDKPCDCARSKEYLARKQAETHKASKKVKAEVPSE